jgi:hypothetical protein
MKLPEPNYEQWLEDGPNDGHYEPLYNIDQMRDMYSQAIEDAAKLCDAECNPRPYDHVTQYASASFTTAEYLADAIRKLKETK